MLQLMDSYAGGWNVLLIAIAECLCIAYVYGKQSFSLMYNDVHRLRDRRISSQRPKT